MQSSSADPIRALCIVADPNKCPPQYELLMKSQDKRDDCDLWKDGVFKSKVTRYLCYSRTATAHESASGQKEVLVDLVIQNDREMPPPGYRLLEKTIDSGEKATNKKQICIKLLPISATTDAISEIVVLSKSKRAPTGFNSIGDINGLMFCLKMTKVTAVEAPSKPNSGGEGSGNRQSKPLPSLPATTPVYAPVSSSTSLQQNNSGRNPLFDVPFRLNPKFCDESVSKSVQSVPKITYKSLLDIEKEFMYLFNLENSTVSQSRL